tara:strand:+ start:7011 stop:7187 length:177 start_codon:yes stop_codon:yes gene_type:complete
LVSGWLVPASALKVIILFRKNRYSARQIPTVQYEPGKIIVWVNALLEGLSSAKPSFAA